MKTFAASRDRVIAVQEALARNSKAAASATRERESALCADELARCVADGVEDWSIIARRLRERCGAA